MAIEERTRIWMYHRVLPVRPTSFGLPGCYHLRGTAITPENWADDLRRLQPIVSLAAVVEALEAGRPTPFGNVITFDDGYLEWSDLVAPSLRATGATATFFITTGMHRAAPQAHAIDAYYWLLDHAAVPVWSLGLPGGEIVRGDLRTEAGKRWLVVDSPIKAAIRDGDGGVQSTTLQAVERAVGVSLPSALADALYMDEVQWRQLSDTNLIGSHGVSHTPLTRLTDAELNDEIVGGRAILRAVTGCTVDFLSYPDGAHDERVVSAVRCADYSASVSVDVGSWECRFAIPRVFRR